MKKLLRYSLFLLLILPAACKEDITPVADFEVIGDNSTAPSEVTFQNTSTNSTSFEWNLGDGTISTDRNIRHTYTKAGTYTVYLIAKSADNQNTKTKNITINEPAPVSNFTFSENGNFAPSKFTFSNTSTNSTYYEWDFGDGSATSTLQNPTHVFTKGGTFNVTLTTKNSKGVQNAINKVITVKNIPTKVTINSISLLAFPATTLSGGGWDLLDGADVFPSISLYEGLYGYASIRKENISKTDLPYNFTLPTAYTTSQLDYKGSISFYDYDGVSANDNMGGYYFTPSTYMPTNGDQYPSTILFQSSTTELKFSINIEWK